MRPRRSLTALLAAVAVAATACTADDTTAGPDTAAQDLSSGEASEAAPESFDRPGATDDGIAPDGELPPEPEPGGLPTEVTFADYGVGEFVTTTDLAASTFATDADTASFALAQAWLDREGVLPPAEAIRVEEWVNALDHGYPDPAPGDTWGITTDAGTPWWTTTTADERTRLLRVGLQATREVERTPIAVTLVVDTSGSMSGERLELVKQAVDGLLAELGPDDRVGLVEYGSQARVVTEPTGDAARVREAVAGLRASGSTNAEDGLVQGFDLARSALLADGTNAVVLLSDGVANVGATGPEQILDRVADEAEDGIALHAVGVGMSNFNDVLLERLANDSTGGYAYVDTSEQASRLFTATLPVLTPVAQDVKAQVTFDPDTIARWRLVGFENRLLAEEDLRDDAVGGGFVGAGHAVTALYEVVPTGRDGAFGSVTVRWDDPVSGEVDEVTRGIDDAATTSRSFPTAAAVAAAAEQLRGSDHVEVDLAEVVDGLRASGDGQDAELADFLDRARGATQPSSPARTPVSPPGIDVEDRAGS